jgi:hypothetical protein
MISTHKFSRPFSWQNSTLFRSDGHDLSPDSVSFHHWQHFCQREGTPLYVQRQFCEILCANNVKITWRHKRWSPATSDFGMSDHSILVKLFHLGYIGEGPLHFGVHNIAKPLHFGILNHCTLKQPLHFGVLHIYMMSIYHYVMCFFHYNVWVFLSCFPLTPSAITGRLWNIHYTGLIIQINILVLVSMINCSQDWLYSLLKYTGNALKLTSYLRE